MPSGNTGGVQSAPNTVGNSQSVFNQTQSPKGPLAVPLRPDWTTIQAYAVDLSLLNGFGTIDMVQTLFIDNTLSGQPFYAVNPTSQQSIVCPAFSQGYFPFLCPNPGKFTLLSAGGVSAPIELLNFPVSPAVWGLNDAPPFIFDGAGSLKTTDETLALVGTTGNKLNVTDVALDAIITAGGLNVNVISGGGGGGGNTWHPTVQPTNPASTGVVNFGRGDTLLFSATNKPILSSFYLYIDPRFFGAAEEIVNWYIHDDKVTGANPSPLFVAAGAFTIPAANPNLLLASKFLPVAELPNLNYKGLYANRQLFLGIAAASASGWTNNNLTAFATWDDQP